MYQSPDFVKVELDVKDNYAGYTGCYRNSWIVLTDNEQVVATGICNVNPVTYTRSNETDYECFVNDMGY